MLLRDSSNKPIRIDNYKILRQLGKGGFGIVYHVCDINDSSKEYALKLLNTTYNVTRLKSQLSVLEITNRSDLFFKIYKVKKMGGQFYILMEYTPDLNVKKLVKKEVFSEAVVLNVFHDILNSLEYLKKNKILHSDIKAENIMKKNDHYYLIDFDVSKVDASMKTVHIQSDNDFTAPEIYEGINDYASDIYSLGCTLYYMLSAEHIYKIQEKYKFSQKMFSHLYLKPIDKHNISSKMMYLIQRMTDKDYKNRANISEIRSILEAKEEKYTFVLKDKKKMQNFTTEYTLYKVMAQGGVSYAQNILGLMYEEGLDVDKNIYKAFRWYECAAKQGLAKAQFNLALCYKLGKACEVDYKKALRYFSLAAEQSHNRSFYELANIYENGLGLERDKKRAVEYYKLASLHGFKPAYKKLKTLP